MFARLSAGSGTKVRFQLLSIGRLGWAHFRGQDASGKRGKNVTAWVVGQGESGKNWENHAVSFRVGSPAK